MSYLMHTPQGATCLTRSFTIEVSVAKLVTHVYYAAYESPNKIDEEDCVRAATNEVFRFWINDDKDDGDIGDRESDVPGQGGWFSKANCDDNKVRTAKHRS